MSRITPIALLVLLIAAGTYVLVFEVREETRFLDEAERREAASRVFDVKDVRAAAGEVVRFTVTRKEGELVFERQGNLWRIAGPVTGPARGDILGELIGMLLALRKLPEDITPDEFPGGGLEAYGLATPRAVLRMVARTDDGAETDYGLRIGDADGTGRSIYAQRPGRENVMRVDRRVVEHLLRPVNDYREVKFLRFDPKGVKALEVVSTQTKVSLERKNDRWMVTRPFADRAASLRMETVLGVIASIEAKTFHDDAPADLAPYGLDAPRIRIAFTRSDGSHATALIGNAAPKPVGTVYAKLEDEPIVYTVPDAVVAPLTFRAEYLRDRKLAWLSPLRVTEFHIEGPSQRLHLRKEGRQGAWKLLSPVKMDADKRTVDRFLRLVAGLEIMRFPNDAPDAPALERCGLDDASRVVLTVKSSDRPERVYAVGKVDAKNKDLYLRRGDVGSVYTVNPEFRDIVTASYLVFRTRRVARIDRNAITALTVRGPDRTVTLERIDRRTWRMTAPVNAPADAINLQNLLEYLHDLEASEFIAEKVDDLSEYGLDKPAREVRMKLADGGAKTLLIGKSVGEGGWAAKLAEGDLVFVVSNTMMELLRRELRSRAVWKFDRRDVSALRWQKGAERVVIRWTGRSWMVVEPDKREINPIQRDNILADLVSLSVRKFEDYTRRNLARYGLDKPRLTVTLTVKDAPKTLSIGKARDRDAVYVMTSDVEGVFTLPASTVKTIEAGLLFPPGVK